MNRDWKAALYIVNLDRDEEILWEATKLMIILRIAVKVFKKHGLNKANLRFVFNHLVNHVLEEA